MLIYGERIGCDLNAANIKVFVFEEFASVLEGVEVSKSEVGGGPMARVAGRGALNPRQ